MPNPFFDHPILNSPYECPPRHWELDEAGQPTQKIVENRRSAKFITPIPKPKKRKAAAQSGFVFDEGMGLSTKGQAYARPRRRYRDSKLRDHRGEGRFKPGSYRRRSTFSG